MYGKQDLQPVSQSIGNNLGLHLVRGGDRGGRQSLKSEPLTCGNGYYLG